MDTDLARPIRIKPFKYGTQGKRISKHIVYPGDVFYSRDTGETFLVSAIVKLFDKARDIAGVPIIINGGYRTLQRQDYLRDQGFKASIRSPHCMGAAFDLSIRTIPGKSAHNRCTWLITRFREAAERLGLEHHVRFGARAYGWTFVHCDVVAWMFEKEVQDSMVHTCYALDEVHLGEPHVKKFYPYGLKNPNPRHWRTDYGVW